MKSLGHLEYPKQRDFDKLLMLSTSDDESDYFISVANRQKTSGVRFSVRTGREFNRFLDSATVVNEKGYDVLLTELKKLEKEALEKEPGLALPLQISGQ